MPEKNIYLIANVAVRPEYRKRGIGRALTLAAMQHAKLHHADETWLHVRDDNPGAIGLYRSLGFEDSSAGLTGRLFQTGMPVPRNSGLWLQDALPEIGLLRKPGCAASIQTC